MGQFEETSILGAAPHRQKTPDARLDCLSPDAVEGDAGPIRLDAEEVVVGSGTGSGARVVADGVAPAHARFFRYGGAWGVEAMQGPGGVTVNHTPLTRCFLKSGDVIALGAARYRYRWADEPDRLSEADANATVVMGPAQAARVVPRPRRPAVPRPAEQEPLPPEAPAAQPPPGRRRGMLAAAVTLLVVAAALAVWWLA